MFCNILINYFLTYYNAPKSALHLPLTTLSQFALLRFFEQFNPSSSTQTTTPQNNTPTNDHSPSLDDISSTEDSYAFKLKLNESYLHF